MVHGQGRCDDKPGAWPVRGTLKRGWSEAESMGNAQGGGGRTGSARREFRLAYGPDYAQEDRKDDLDDVRTGCTSERESRDGRRGSAFCRHEASRAANLDAVVVLRTTDRLHVAR